MAWLPVNEQPVIVALPRFKRAPPKESIPRTGRRHVVGQQTLGESQAGADLVGDPAAVGGIGGRTIAAAADGRVVGQRAVVDRQRAEVVDPASLDGQAVGDRQVVDRRRTCPGRRQRPPRSRRR